MRRFSYVERQKNLSQVDEQVFDLVIIGGGIVGAGVAREAALRGMKVVLVEARDFASGTSSRSSKLIHGGIRYLENLEFHLVFEALNERNLLFEMAPHLVHHLRFMIPLYKNSRVGMLKMGLGMWLYDALALFQAPQLHERLNAEKTINRMPSLRKENLVGSFVYSDGYMDDDRLVIETLRSADAAGALCFNDTPASRLHIDDGKIRRLEICDSITSKTYTLRGKHFVSCVGPWTDIFAGMNFNDWKPIMRPTKGIHLTLKKDRLPLSCAVVMAAEKSERIIFGIPRHEMIIIGTTDTDYRGDPADVVTTAEDVDYLLEIVEQYFPGARLKKEDIVACYAGVRPLVDDGSESEGKTSREHTIFSDQRGITFVAGGKYTTYRKISEDVVKECLKFFSSADKEKFSRSRSKDPLNPAVTAPSYFRALQEAEELAKSSGQDVTLVRTLVERHGPEAEEMLKKYPGQSYWAMEAFHSIHFTMCMNITDFFTRRSHLFLTEKDHGLSYFDEVARVFASEFKWTNEEILRQREGFSKHISREMEWAHF
ncbi:MAG: glycerol-3-phosphate dehydrogenase/oxidase [Bdellovibrionaceae bacterium]|nr:glycerol-3-phosphate dehydrogenase/oxidase [Pseudobdellovibrionaceae bacterium]